MSIQIEWPDGEIIEGQSVDEIYDKIKQEQYADYGGVLGDLRFRRDMQRIARAWSGRSIRILASRAGFIDQLVQAQVLRCRVVSPGETGFWGTNRAH